MTGVPSVVWSVKSRRRLIDQRITADDDVARGRAVLDHAPAHEVGQHGEDGHDGQRAADHQDQTPAIAQGDGEALPGLPLGAGLPVSGSTLRVPFMLGWILQAK